MDYITKPISAPITMLRVKTQLALVDQRRALEDQIAARTEELHDTRLELIQRLARAMEFREGGLTNRVLRVGEYVGVLAQSLGLKSKVVEILSQAAPLYDIGKMGVSEHILTKTDALNDKEWEEMRKHPEIGAGIIGEHKDPLLEQARIMALTHHERWDGTGYPKKLKGNAIPLPGRIMAVADAFEAMTSTQRHRSPISSHGSGEEDRRRIRQAVRPRGGRRLHEGREVLRRNPRRLQGRARGHPRPQLRAGEEEVYPSYQSVGW